MDATLIDRIILQTCQKVEQYYVFPDVGKKISNHILTKHQNKQYYEFTKLNELLTELKADFLFISNDKHLYFTQSEKTIQKDGDGDIEFANRGIDYNFGFSSVKRLPGNVGYIDIRNFYPPYLAGDTAVSAMNLVSNTEALIFDIRKNGGGVPEMCNLLISYLLEGDPIHLTNFYYRETEKVDQFWTSSHVPGKRFGKEKPVFVLTSNYTFSAAEEFAFNLQYIKRATVIGETTGGGAHPGGFKKIIDTVNLFIPHGRAFNPYTNKNWEGIGVIPDIQTSKEQAFNIAYSMSLDHIISSVNKDFLLKEAKEQHELLSQNKINEEEL